VRSLILSGGSEPYIDPWHPFAATTERLSGILEHLGHDVEVSFDVADRLADLDGVDLLVSNAPMPSEPAAEKVASRADDALREFVARGGGILALHVAVTTLLGLPFWTELMGVRWVNGTTIHAPLGTGRVSARADARTGAARSFELVDERYAHLALGAPLEVLVEHEYEGVEHPLVWARDLGGTRIVADALGHGTESYDSPDHVEVLERSARWLTAHSS
jgi:type 1 glutamine amidotransferase